MDSIDDIWDAPVELPAPQQPEARRSSSSLLPGSDDGRDEHADPPAASSNPDIDALFADIENQGLTYQPALDLDALRREADARYARTATPTTLTPHAILPSSSPARDVDDNRGDGKGKGRDDGGKKTRRKMPRLDEGRLLGPDGFPRLIQDAKNFRPKGKGHEVRLNSITAAISSLLIQCRKQTSTGCSRCTSSGRISCTQRLSSRIQSRGWRNYAIPDACMYVCPHICLLGPLILSHPAGFPKRLAR
jgi:hypothetical protein